MTSPNEIQLSLSLVIQIVFYSIVCVGTVFTIRTTTAVLNESINNLKDTIDDLSKTISTIQEKYNNHNERIARIEAQLSK